MLTMEDCVQMSDLSEEEIAAIAEHERLPALAATELGHYLLHSPDELRRITAMLEDSIGMALERRDGVHAEKLLRVLSQFRREHAGSIAGAMKR
jgi:hypothetical protein